ncbi:ABC transporter ATP-binding protein [Janthinobacterium agaricidamnosum]|uniref:ABC transporter family protein n=1 Tax=Janthinobacterium agaricidamnosum NBRC 102515 = DSM 9628 TaxID=1349767 RepID=W0V135_9BURK|nr:ABC transporter ATP-binding protein [Janthinobacterium agaricidamnosum]CDG81043.1 ABC transporter family protein [Janthinobacterium agaricidamnosum NBRC 102515 = DSM 9628]
MSYLELHKLTLGYAKNTTSVKDLDLNVEKGELISLLGPSGCGKTTTMRAIAGLMPMQSGRIVLDGREIGKLAPNKRNIGMVFQSYALFPHLNVFDNVAFGLRLRKVPQQILRGKVEAVIAAVGLSGFETRLPAQMSGGQQQRVALARAIVVEPDLLLLDEPLSNLDAKLRVQMRAELRRIQRELGITMLYVTHDQEEALALSDRIVVMNGGRIEQLAVPEAVFNTPASRFVANFMGFENLFDYRDGALHHDGSSLPYSAPVLPGTKVLGWRPDRVLVCGLGDPAGQYTGVVAARGFLGDTVEYLLQTAIGTVKGISAAGGPAWPEGTEVMFALPASGALCLTA